MAIDLNDKIKRQGAIDALRTILKSKKAPIIVTQSPTNSGSNGPTLQPPKNVKVKPSGPQQPQQPKKSTPPDDTPNNSKGPIEQPGQNNDSQEVPKDLSNSDIQADSTQNDQSPQQNDGSDEGGQPHQSKKDKVNNTDDAEIVDPLDELDDSETDEERAARLSKVTKDLSQDELEQDIEDIKRDTEIRQGEILKAKKKALDDITKSINGADLKPFTDFSADLFRAINSQVKKAKHKADTYRRPNASYAGTDYLMPGKDYPDKKEIPVIAVYFDQSASWGARDIKKGTEALASIRQFEVQKKVKIKLFFFAEHLHDTPEPAQYEGGTGGFPEVLEHIANPMNKVTNAIIMTDHDIEYQTDWNTVLPARISGCVWFLWKKGSRSKTAPKYLKGTRGNFEYELQ